MGLGVWLHLTERHEHSTLTSLWNTATPIAMTGITGIMTLRGAARNLTIIDTSTHR
jgi:hypothetical protein